MDNLNLSFAANLCALRKNAGLTQLELAERLNYSDKAVSKWERGESIPDITVLMRIADMFGVSVDYLMKDRSEEPASTVPATQKHRWLANRILIMCIVAAGIWVVAVLTYVVLRIFFPELEKTWLCFVYPVPVCCITLFILNCIWGKKWFSYVLISIFIWTVLALIYLQAYPYAGWLIFLIGIPLQVIVVLASGIVKTKKRREKTQKNGEDKQDDEKND